MLNPLKRPTFRTLWAGMGLSYAGDRLQELAQGWLVATLNNESCELNEHRIKKFKLRELFSIFFTSCYLGVRKPDEKIYQLALGITQRVGIAYRFGGFYASSAADPAMFSPTGEHAVIECQGKIHSIAGYAKHRVDQNFHQVYDPASTAAAAGGRFSRQPIPGRFPALKPWNLGLKPVLPGHGRRSGGGARQ